MQRTAPIERVKGTFDLLPQEHAALAQILTALRERFEHFGYRGIDTPVVEHAELHLRKSGRDIISKLYSFDDFSGRRLCLRPEMTASVMRAFLAGMAQDPLPARLCYAGPVFRYERPQRGRYRQFLSAGVELIGAEGILADVEVIRLACECVEQLGLKEYRVRIGHLGILAGFLDSLGLDARTRDFLIASMEELGKEGRGVEYLAERLEALGMSGDAPEEQLAAPLAEFLDGAPAEDAQPALAALLRQRYGTIEGGRTPEEIARRLAAKLQARQSRAAVGRALDFLRDATAVCGPAPAVFADLRALLARYELDDAPCRALEELFTLLNAYGPLAGEVVVDLGFGRGLEYYTGIIFEIHVPGQGAEGEICGGGRYDGLAAVLGGGERIPACGFAFGVERLKLALEAQGKAAPLLQAPEVLVIPVDADARDYAVSLAGALRAQGVRVELDVRARGVKKALQYADRVGAAYAVVAGAAEKAGSYVTLRDMRARAERQAPADRLRVAAREVLEGRLA